jgi:signal transduction histidine kinase
LETHEASKTLEMILHTAQYMKFTVRDLLDRSLLDNSNLTLNIVSVDLQEAISQTIEIVNTQASLKNIKVISLFACANRVHDIDIIRV